MFWKKKGKSAAEKEIKCNVCGVECFDQNSLERHLEWVHKEVKIPAK